MKNVLRWRPSILLLSALLLIGRGVNCLAQSNAFGDIRGTVTDPTGALIPGVTITVLNVDTGVSKTFTSDNAGVYDTSSIVLGSYTLTFSKDGFGQLVR